MVMGIYDREYSREDEPTSGYQLGLPRSIVTSLIIINVAVFIANALFASDQSRNWLNSTLSLHSSVFAKPWLWWEFLTYGFVHDSRNINHLLFNMLGLWCFGKTIEARYGWREFLTFYLTAIVICGVLWAAKFLIPSANLNPNSILLGASGAITAVVLLFVLHYPNQTILLFMVIPAPAWVLGLLIVVGNLFGARSADGGVAYDVHLTGAAFAACYFWFGWNLSALVPSVGWFSRLKRGAKRITTSRPQLRVRSAESDDSYQNQDDEADRILAKLHDLGDAALTPVERRILEDYSRRMRQKHR